MECAGHSKLPSRRWPYEPRQWRWKSSHQL